MSANSGSQLVSVNNTQLDAFSRLRTTLPTVLFDSKLLTSISGALYWSDIQVAGTTTTTYNTNQASQTIAVTAVSSRRLRQTFRYFNYQPGRAMTIFMTGIISVNPNANATSYIGYYDDRNGLFF